jgi:hypothetical protein
MISASANTFDFVKLTSQPPIDTTISHEHEARAVKLAQRGAKVLLEKFHTRQMRSLLP